MFLDHVVYICFNPNTGRRVLPQGGCVVFCSLGMFGGLSVSVFCSFASCVGSFRNF